MAGSGGRIDVSLRRDTLSWHHHKAVSVLEPSEQDELLDRAIKEEWTIRELRRAVRALKAARIHREAGLLLAGKEGSRKSTTSPSPAASGRGRVSS